MKTILIIYLIIAICVFIILYGADYVLYRDYYRIGLAKHNTGKLLLAGLFFPVTFILLLFRKILDKILDKN